MLEIQHTSSVSPVYGRLKTIVLQCRGWIEAEGHEVNEFIEASDGWILCSLPILCTTHPGVIRVKKLKKIGYSYIADKDDPVWPTRFDLIVNALAVAILL